MNYSCGRRHWTSIRREPREFGCAPPANLADPTTICGRATSWANCSASPSAACDAQSTELQDPLKYLDRPLGSPISYPSSTYTELTFQPHLKASSTISHEANHLTSTLLPYTFEMAAGLINTALRGAQVCLPRRIVICASTNRP